MNLERGHPEVLPELLADCAAWLVDLRCDPAAGQLLPKEAKDAARPPPSPQRRPLPSKQPFPGRGRRRARPRRSPLRARRSGRSAGRRGRGRAAYSAVKRLLGRDASPADYELFLGRLLRPPPAAAPTPATPDPLLQLPRSSLG
eukprot:gene4109-16178_t